MLRSSRGLEFCESTYSRNAKKELKSSFFVAKIAKRIAANEYNGEKNEKNKIKKPIFDKEKTGLKPQKNTYTKVDENGIIMAKLERVMQEQNIKGKLIYPPTEIDVSDYDFDYFHINDERGHNITEKEIL